MTQPERTIVIFDLPEVIALQFFFLTFSLSETKTIVHETPPQQLDIGIVHQ